MDGESMRSFPETFRRLECIAGSKVAGRFRGSQDTKVLATWRITFGVHANSHALE